jgi:two-component system, LytTR family, sensor kinase
MSSKPWRRHVTYWSAVFLCALLLFLYRFLGNVAEGGRAIAREPLINEFTGVFGAALLVVLFLRPLTRRLPLGRQTWPQRLPIYLGVLVAFSLAHTTLNWGSRSILYPLFGCGAYDYGRLPVIYLMEFPIDVIGFTLFTAGFHIFDAYRASRDRELRTEQLERALAESRLHSLRLQLQPHFLFNALNTISSRMYEDVSAADEMLTHLAELLRASLRTASVQLVPLASELGALDHYTAIMRGRFGDQVRVTIDVPPSCQEALVPSLVLQPLVENAVRHGNASRTGQGCIEVSARREGDRLVLRVEDDGPGAAHDVDASEGIGLRSTRDRLRILFGDAQRFEAANAGRGFRVVIEVPWRS